jgi:hypothetical protein
METEDEKAKAQNLQSVDLTKIPLEQPEDGVFSVYSNIVNLDWTLYDVRLRFGELIQVPDDANPSWENQHGVVLETAAVRLPWHQAKLLRNMLDQVVRNYEEVNGELKPITLPASGPPPSL